MEQRPFNRSTKGSYAKLQTKQQQKITDYIDDTPLLTPDDLKWKKHHEAKVISGKRIRGTDPAYQHMQYYPVTLTSKQAATMVIEEEPKIEPEPIMASDHVDLAKIYLSPMAVPSHKKRKRVN